MYISPQITPGGGGEQMLYLYLPCQGQGAGQFVNKSKHCMDAWQKLTLVINLGAKHAGGGKFTGGPLGLYMVLIFIPVSRLF